MQLSKHEQTIRNLAEKAFANHTIVQRLDVGLFRSWRCQKPGSWNYGFDVTTTPGCLHVTGDLGSVVYEREADMLEWLRKAIGDLHYMVGKIDSGNSKTKWDDEAAEAWLKEQLADPDCAEEDKRVLQECLELDDGDLPTFQRPTESVIWFQEALRWFLNNLPA